MGALDSLIYRVLNRYLPVHHYFHFLHRHFFSWLQSYVDNNGHRSYDNFIVIECLYHLHITQENELWNNGASQVQVICLGVLCAGDPDRAARVHILDQVSLR